MCEVFFDNCKNNDNDYFIKLIELFDFTLFNLVFCLKHFIILICPLNKTVVS